MGHDIGIEMTFVGYMNIAVECRSLSKNRSSGT